MRKLCLFCLAASVAALAAGLLSGQWAAAAPVLQAATATPPANRVEIYQDVNVRAGPGTEYDQVGVLIPGQTSPILGQSPDGIWLRIEYIGGPDNIGWIFGAYARIIGDLTNVPALIAPPTPTLRPTTTAAPGSTSGPLPIETQNPNAGVLPTFTAPAPQGRPTLLPAQGVGEGGSFPPAALIIVLFVLGSFGGMLSVLRFRR